MPRYEWDRFRAEIERLYIAEDKTLVEVIDILAKTRGLDASKSSFEKKLRQWGLIKYDMGRLKWSAVGRIIERRRRAGKSSDVYIRGQLVSQDKVRKEMSRHVPLTIRSQFAMDLIAPSPEPPDGVVVCSPPASYNGYSWDDSSPWLQFLGIIRKSGAYIATSTALAYGNQTTELLVGNPGSMTRWPCLGLLSTSGRWRHNDSERMEALMKLQDSAWVAESLCRIMPDEYPDQHTSTANEIVSGKASESGLLLQLFLLSNNFSLSDRPHYGFPDGPHDAHVSSLVESILSARPENLAHLLSLQCVVGEAIKDHIFWWALRCGKEKVLRLLWSLGYEPDTDNRYSRRFCPLQTAASIRNKRDSARIIRLLLEHHARIDDSLDAESALNIAIATDNQEAANLLMEAGTPLSLSSLAAAIQAGNKGMVERVLSTGVDVNAKLPRSPHWGLERWTPLPHAAHRGHLDIVKTLVGHGADVSATHRISKIREVYHCGDVKFETSALGIAVAAGQTETIRFLAHICPDTKVRNAANYIWPLVVACVMGDAEIIGMLLHAGADVRHADASVSEHEGVRSFVLSVGAKEDWIGIGAQTLLEILIMYLKDDAYLVEISKMFVERGACVDRALIIATKKRKIEVVELLIHHGARLSKQEGIPATALGAAVEMGNVDLARMLHQAGAREMGAISNIQGTEMADFLDSVGLLEPVLQGCGRSMLFQAILGGEATRWLRDSILKTNLDLSHSGHFVLSAAVQSSLDVDFMKEMIQRGASCRFDLRRAVEEAIELDAPDEVVYLLFTEYMLVAKGDPEEFSLAWVPLDAVRRGSQRIFNIILKAMDWPSQDLGIVLIHAIHDANYDAIHALLEAGAYLGKQPSGSPLKSAVFEEQEWLVKMLLDAGADARDGGALFEAVRLGNMNLVEILLAAGADPNSWNSWNCSTLEMASYLGFLAIARRLIDAGADVNGSEGIVTEASTGEYGMALTPLTAAASKGRLEVLHLLLNRGAVIHGAGRDQYVDAVRVGYVKRQRAVVRLLKSHGGWTESDERLIKQKHEAAMAAWKAFREEPNEVDNTSDSHDASDDNAASDNQHLGKQDETRDLEGQESGTLVRIEDWKGGCLRGTVSTDFDDFFLHELTWLQGSDYTMNDEGWIFEV